MLPSDSQFDFEQARSRLDELRSALDASSDVTVEKSEALLKERAIAYARAPERTLLASEQIEILVFQFCGERYAIESRFVAEVLREPAVTDVPGTPPLLQGVTNLRGEILAVMDLSGLLGTSHTTGQTEWVLVLGEEHDELGIAVDEVIEVTRVRTEEVLPPARAAREFSREWIRGITSEATVILNGRAILNDQRLHIDIAET
jgi:purine-binding chemotaxis protein CheW